MGCTYSVFEKERMLKLKSETMSHYKEPFLFIDSNCEHDSLTGKTMTYSFFWWKINNTFGS